MEVKVIPINRLKIGDKYSKNCLEYLDNVTTTDLNDVNKNSISFENIISFIMEYGIEAKESDSEIYRMLMYKYHNSIIFYGIQYYLPKYKFTPQNQDIYNYLVQEYKVT